MSKKTNRKGVSIEEKKLIVKRTFPAPRPLVFETYSSCTHLKEWWGPRTWPMVECSLEFKEGGRWHYCLRGPKPEDASWGLAIYQTIQQPKLLVYTDYFSNEAGEINKEMPGMLISIEFQEKGEETTVVSTTEFDSNETRDSIIEMGVIDGFSETWDRLEELVGEVRESRSEVVENRIAISRIIRAPRERVFDAFSTPETIGQWWGPNGFTTTTKEMTFQSGGEWIYTMHGPDGTNYPNRILYKEIDRPRRLRYIHDEGKDTVPEDQFRVTTTFEPIGDFTRVVHEMTFFDESTRKHVQEEVGAIEGGKQTLGRLAQLVEAR